jgi:hypothetical protein
VNDPAAILLGYLNFSSGAFDPAAWRALSALYAEVEPAGQRGVVERADAAERVHRVLRQRLDVLERESPAFRDATQARRVLEEVFAGLLSAYRRFHADLLEHQPPGALERPFFVMAVAQAALAESGADREGDGGWPARVIARLNDYVGWRPVAVLENERLSEPYPHERVRPVPVYLAGAGPAHGRHADAVGTAVTILERAPRSLLRQADFDPTLLEELAIDPRAFDFLHPAASRPNYLFGLWDPARIDEAGFYRRMVVQQVTLDGILSWPDAAARGAAADAAGLDAERRWEAAAVLAGVVLMAAGLSGHGPGSLQASLPLAELLPRIAGYRDEFYRWLLTTVPAGHRRRLEEEAERMRQPFGGVRRHINAVLAGQRARQVENVALASIFARLGRAAAAERLAGTVPAASARMLSRITSRVVAARRRLRQTVPDRAGALDDLDAAADLLLRAVDCGATVDPWNILGMAGQFPLHEPGGESLPDPRVDDLVATTESILEGCATVWRGADLAGDALVAARAEAALLRMGRWWDRFATTTVSGVPHLSGQEVAASAREVVAALKRRRGSTHPPTAGFWRQEVADFSSPRTHAEAADALIHERDLDGASGLIVHWASLLEGEVIERSGQVWIGVASRWLEQALADATADGRTRVRRFLERVEANLAGVTDLVEAAAAGREPGTGHDDLPDHDGDIEDGQAPGEESVAAAYESMVWHDSTDDGVDGGMIDVDLPGGESAGGAAALQDAAELTTGVCRLVVRAVTAWCAADVAAGGRPSRDERDAVAGWWRSLRRLRRGLTRAAAVVVERDREPAPGMSPTEFDRVRWQRDAAAERLIDAAVLVSETLWVLAAHRHVGRRAWAGAGPGGRASVGRLLARAMIGDAAGVAAELVPLGTALSGLPVLYVPLSRGGRPDRIVRARARERLLERLAACLPRLGLVGETIALVQLAKSLENRRPAGAASVSEFDRVFEAATMALVDRIVRSAAAAAQDATTPRILDALSLLVPRLLETWMTHARQLRLSVLERCRDERAFAAVSEFVERYGSGLFTQHLLAPSALRGILRGGVRRYLERLVEFAEFEPAADAPGARPERLLADLRSGALPWRQAASRMRLVLETVAENHAEYRDWNSTTTQSDRGECLHILLDFLRVKAEYDRIVWTLRPVNMAHRVLARHGAADAADAWRRRMADETQETAAALMSRLDALEARWSVRLASVADRVRRPFTAALELDELEALAHPAVAELVTGVPPGAGDRLETKAESFLGVASGSGVEVPDWLDRLGALVDRALERHEVGLAGQPADGREGWLAGAVPWVPVSWDDLHGQLAGG